MAEFENIVLRMRPHFVKRLRLRDAVLVESRADDSYLSMPQDIVQYVLLPMIPDLRRNITWMQRKLQRAASREADFLDHYGATNPDGDLLYEDDIPLLDRTTLEDLFNTSSIPPDDDAYGKFIGDVFVVKKLHAITVSADSGEHDYRAPRNDHLHRCKYIGGELLQMITLESGTFAGARDVFFYHIDMITNTVTRSRKYKPRHILPCGLLLVTNYDMGRCDGLYNIETDEFVPIPFDRTMHYDDFGQTTPKPNYLFYDKFNPKFGRFIVV